MHSEAFWARSVATAIRANRYLAAAAAVIPRIVVAEVTPYHAVRTFVVWAANTTGRLATVVACILRIGLTVAKGAGYRAIWACSTHLMFITAWQVADITLPSSLIFAVPAISFLKHRYSNTICHYNLCLGAKTQVPKRGSLDGVWCRILVYVGLCKRITAHYANCGHRFRIWRAAAALGTKIHAQEVESLLRQALAAGACSVHDHTASDFWTRPVPVVRNSYSAQVRTGNPWASQ